MIDILSDHWLILLIGQYPHGPLGGLAMTVIMAVTSLALALPLALAIAVARTEGTPRIARAAQIFVDLVRAIPLLMFVFWVYFAAPVLLGRPIGGVATMIAALVIYESSYLSEIVRAGIEAIPDGQIEAARSLGLRRWPILSRVVLPQALQASAPSLIVQLNSTVKETSLAFVISAPELTFSATQINAVLMTRPLKVFALLAAVYFCLCGSLSLAAGLMETQFRRRRAN
ncbi:amino acid ABC transporter permease [Siculibacillus lacustris]|uniref:Amino acid ABC transporter permease n=1 Tax=Siculibacillus lacustris TaxID=1549641 RepID=A0A4Q9W028_9HYPH|nr:amino acid ABC transporter permease [Siculibacillus lacustris]TBW41293.1 amino acid ABC transporter permease [Siculibacillus lacustris]